MPYCAVAPTICETLIRVRIAQRNLSRVGVWLTCKRGGSVEDGLRVRLNVDEGFDDTGSSQTERPIQSILEGFYIFRRPARHAEVMGRRLHGLAEMNARKLVAFAFLFDLHESEPTVVENNRGHCQIQAPSQGQLTDRHLKAAVAHNRHDSAVRKNKLSRKRRRHAVTHRRPAVSRQ